MGVERRLALVSSFSPTNLEDEVGRSSRALIRGAREELHFRYRPTGEATSREVAATIVAARLALSDVERVLTDCSEFVELMAARIDELDDELSLIRARGSDEVRLLSVKRFAFSGEELSEARTVAAQWVELDQEEPSDFVFSLLPQLDEKCRQMGEGSLGMKIAEHPIAGLAAVGADTLYVRPEASASPKEAERLWVHEVHGHLLPRLRARSAHPLRRLGTPGCVEDDEGWAIFLEEQAGLLLSSRKVELARRFLLADTMRVDGFSAAWDLSVSLVRSGHPDRSVARTLCRVARGGGLSREVVYLPGYLRVSKALGENPEWRSLFESGRASVRGCSLLSQWTSPHVA